MLPGEFQPNGDAKIMPKAVRYDEFGGVDVLRVEEVERPVPGGAQVLAEPAGLIADGHLEVPIAGVYPLAQVREACTELERRHTHGKIILRP